MPTGRQLPRRVQTTADAVIDVFEVPIGVRVAKARGLVKPVTGSERISCISELGARVVGSVRVPAASGSLIVNESGAGIAAMIADLAKIVGGLSGGRTAWRVTQGGGLCYSCASSLFEPGEAFIPVTVAPQQNAKAVCRARVAVLRGNQQTTAESVFYGQGALRDLRALPRRRSSGAKTRR